MEQLRYLLPALVLILGITLAYGSYRRQVQRPVVSRSFVTWINLLIMIVAVTLGAGMAVQDALGFVVFAAIVMGLYFFVVRPRLFGKNE